MVVEPQIQMAEIERSRRERPESLAAYDVYLQAVPMINTETQGERGSLCAAHPGAGARAGQRATGSPMPPGRRAPQRHGLAADRAGRPADQRRTRAASASAARRSDGHGALQDRTAADRQATTIGG